MDFITRLKDYICYYCTKHEQEAMNKSTAFEKNFLSQLRGLILLASVQRRYWNIFMGNKFEYILEQKPEEALIILELDFPHYQASKNKKKLFLFQKQGINPTFAE